MNELFKVHKLNETGLARAGVLAQKFDELLAFIEAGCEPSRELSLVKTKMEEACFYAKKSMAMKAEYQENG